MPFARQVALIRSTLSGIVPFEYSDDRQREDDGGEQEAAHNYEDDRGEHADQIDMVPRAAAPLTN